MTKFIPIPEFNDKDWFRLCSHIEFPSDDEMSTKCWLCDLCQDKDGYPQFGMWDSKLKKRTSYKAIRVMLGWMFGDNPNLTAGHAPHDQCGNHHCVSPYHLSWQTYKEQTENQIKDGTFAYGEKNGSAKLSKNQIIEIREKYLKGDISYRQLAKQYLVSKSNIADILRNKSWKHIYSSHTS